MHPPKVRDLGSKDRSVAMPAIAISVCLYCGVPFFLDEEKEDAFIMQAPDGMAFFAHEECYNAKLKLN